MAMKTVKEDMETEEVECEIDFSISESDVNIS